MRPSAMALLGASLLILPLGVENAVAARIQLRKPFGASDRAPRLSGGARMITAAATDAPCLMHRSRELFRCTCSRRSAAHRLQSAAPSGGGILPNGRSRTLICCYAALCCLIGVKAVVAQALPELLAELQSQPERVAETLSTVAAGSAALEFALLPAIAALSDTYGRRPLLIAIPILTFLLRLLVVTQPCLLTLVISRVVVGALVNYFDLFVGVTAADLFTDDADALASLEGKTAAAWGAAFAGGMLVGGKLLSRGAGAFLGGPLGAYTLSAGLAALALIFTLGVRESLPRESRVPFSVRGSSPLGFLRLFRSGKLVGLLAAILALQTLHDGEGDVWQVYGTDVHGWSTAQNSLYGASVGVASTTGGLLTGASVRALGNQQHTLLWTLSTAVASVLFSVRSSLLAALSIVFTAAEDCMSASVCAKLVQAGATAGISQGQLAGDIHNLSAIVRVFGLYTFGRLYLFGQSYGLPSLPYLLCAMTQVAAAVLVLAIPAAQWQSGRKGTGGRDVQQ